MSASPGSVPSRRRCPAPRRAPACGWGPSWSPDVTATLVQRVELAVLDGDHDVGDVAVDHVVGARTPPRRSTCPRRASPARRRPVRRRTSSASSARVVPSSGVGTSALAQLLEHHGGVGEFAAGAAELLGHHQRGDTDLLAQQLPQRFVVAALGLHCRAHRLGRRVLLDQRGDGVAQQFPFFAARSARSRASQCLQYPPAVPRRVAPCRAQRLHPQQQQRQVVLLGEADRAVGLQRRPRREQRRIRLPRPWRR